MTVEMTESEARLDTLSSEASLYLLGFIAASARVDGERVWLKKRLPNALHAKLSSLFDLFEGRHPLDKRAHFVFENPALRRNMAHWLGSHDPENYRLPAELDEKACYVFARGCFDAKGQVSGKNEPRCRLELTGKSLGQDLLKLFPAARRSDPVLEWRGNNALDLLGFLYSGASLFDADNHRSFLQWAHRLREPPRRATIKFSRLLPGSVAPCKHRITDSGYDLTLIRKVRQGGLVTFYGTGLSVEPPFGWYVDVVPRSSIVKLGYVLANSVGVVDRGYRGEILVPLIKLDPSAPELELPSRAVQLVPRPIVHFELSERPNLASSARGAGGFGSTGP